jgi:hypothetical protein
MVCYHLHYTILTQSDMPGMLSVKYDKAFTPKLGVEEW